MSITLANGRVYPLQELSTLELVAAMECTGTQEARHLITAELIKRASEQVHA